jgi:hypothetical protein
MRQQAAAFVSQHQTATKAFAGFLCARAFLARKLAYSMDPVIFETEPEKSMEGGTGEKRMALIFHGFFGDSFGSC